jgi:hypothetical protein
MANLTLTGQSTLSGTIGPKLVQLKNAMDLRKPIFQKLEFAKKKIWVLSSRDPIMGLAWDVYKYLYDFFGGVNPGDVS